MRYIGLDYGSKTVGVAISDELNMMAHPMETIFRNRETKLRQTLSRIRDIIEDNSITVVVVGYPYSMDDSRGERCDFTDTFVEKLTKILDYKLDIRLCDERLSTFEADELLDEMRVKNSEKKRYIDQISASLILQRYLDEEHDGR